MTDFYVCSEKQAAKGKHSVPPKEERQTRKEINGGGAAPICSHHCSNISLLHCEGQALPQVGEQLGLCTCIVPNKIIT